MSTTPAHTRAAVHRLLQSEQVNPILPWTLQGLGMLRLYLTDDKSVRLHVWDDRHAFPGASEMHTHPWDMKSTVLSGTVENIRYSECHPQCIPPAGSPYCRQSIFCGEGGGLEGDPIAIGIVPFSPELYLRGDSYQQSAGEIHVSRPTLGAVTLVERSFRGDVDHAYVYWPADTEWVSAEPRPATLEEVREILSTALGGWQNDHQGGTRNG